MFTGRYPHEVSADWLRPLDDEHPTLAEALAGSGYATGAFVGNLAYLLREHGTARGFLHYEDLSPIDPAVLGFSTAVGERLLVRAGGNSFNEWLRNDAAHVTDRALRWIEGIGGDRPFFCFLNYYDPHLYYLAPPPYDAEFGPPSPHLREWYSRKDWTEQEQKGFIAAYDGCIAYADQQLGRLLDGLRALSRLDRTVVVVTSDHGELFWEHGLTEHGNSLYRPLLHAPLIVLDPRGAGQRRIAAPVTLRDLPATILDLTGIPPGRLPGNSLAWHWREGESAGPADPSPLLAAVSQGIGTAETPHSKGDLRSIIAHGYHYIARSDGAEELYALDDTREERNLAEDPAFAGKLSELRQALANAWR
jgi:arylsulfatase A-like enzyme